MPTAAFFGAVAADIGLAAGIGLAAVIGDAACVFPLSTPDDLTDSEEADFPPIDAAADGLDAKGLEVAGAAKTGLTMVGLARVGLAIAGLAVAGLAMAGLATAGFGRVCIAEGLNLNVFVGAACAADFG